MSSFGVELNNSLRSPHFKVDRSVPSDILYFFHLFPSFFTEQGSWAPSCTVGPILENKKSLQLVALLRCLRSPHLQLFFQLFGAGTAIRMIHDGLSSQAPRFDGNGKATRSLASDRCKGLSSDVRCNFWRICDGPPSRSDSGSLLTRCQRRSSAHGSTICDGCCPREGPMDSIHQMGGVHRMPVPQIRISLCAMFRLKTDTNWANGKQGATLPRHTICHELRHLSCHVHGQLALYIQKSLESVRESRAFCQTARSRAWHRRSVIITISYRRVQCSDMNRTCRSRTSKYPIPDLSRSSAIFMHTKFQSRSADLNFAGQRKALCGSVLCVVRWGTIAMTRGSPATQANASRTKVDILYSQDLRSTRQFGNQSDSLPNSSTCNIW